MKRSNFFVKKLFHKKPQNSVVDEDKKDEIEDLKCPICLEYLEGATETSCGHAFCCMCILQYIDTGNSSQAVVCPTCRELVTFVHPSFALRQLVARLKNKPKNTVEQQRQLDNRLSLVYEQRQALVQEHRRTIQRRQARQDNAASESKLFIHFMIVFVLFILIAWVITLQDANKPTLYFQQKPTPAQQATKSPTTDKPKIETPVQPVSSQSSKLNNDEEGLLEASSKGDFQRVELILNSKPSIIIDARNDKQQTPLYLASAHGSLEIIKLLLERGANINAASVDNATPLYVAAEYGKLDVVQHLVNNGAEIDTRFRSGATPLVIASQNGYTNIVRFLLERGANPATFGGNKENSLHLAATKGYLEIVTLLVKAGSPVNEVNNAGMTALYLASRGGHLDVVKYLFEEGRANPHITSTENASPLYVAAEYGKAAVVRYLVKKCDAKVDAVFNTGATPLVIASEKGFTDIVQFLLYEANADAEKAGAGGWNALHLATLGGFVDICRMLIDKGSPLDHQDQKGDTCLHIAIQKEFVAVASLLVKYGANYLIANNEGKTARQLLVQHPNMKHILEGVVRVSCRIIPLPLKEEDKHILVPTVVVMNNVSTLRELARRMEVTYKRTIHTLFDNGGEKLVDYEKTTIGSLLQLSGSKKRELVFKVSLV